MYEEKITSQDLDIWILKTRPGEQLTYVIGSSLFVDNKKSDLAEKAYEAYEAGKVMLYQKKLGENVFEFIIQRIPESWKHRAQRIRGSDRIRNKR